jgi:hypothetical protein
MYAVGLIFWQRAITAERSKGVSVACRPRQAERRGLEFDSLHLFAPSGGLVQPFTLLSLVPTFQYIYSVPSTT